ncbi:Neogenin like [Actinidia chinensis var. chinensis]|uniref:Neogenin like n=1 Tax=Actinidia chinensis var. chinensis TaxID=1590841 RepID=A0A2R6QKR8_ACTCC|nr:Neogenin like [Actinidia chinensis var. chinensis]
MDAEEEALFRSYPYALYFVQSPSTLSHAHTTATESAFHSPSRPEQPDPARFTLSRCSSSRGSNHSFLHEKKVPYDLGGTEKGESRPIGVLRDGILDCGDDDEEEEGEDDFGNRKDWWWRYLSFRTSSSFGWICLQVIWRFLVSLGVALLVFYIATKPPIPQMSLKIAGIREFGLGEGVDASGVSTKILTCNCSLDLVIDNKSKLFGLHLHPPLMDLSFANLPLAISYGPKLYAGSDGSTLFQLHVATANKPVYGAGRAMQDMLDMRKGLPLAIHVSLRSRFWVVWGLINTKFHHKAVCLLVLDRAYDKKHRTQAYNSSCMMTT